MKTQAEPKPREKRFLAPDMCIRLPATGLAQLLAACLLLACSIAMADIPAEQHLIEYEFEVVNVYPHDPAAFTQGLVFIDGALYESTGLFGQSSLRKVELETGKVSKIYKAEDRYFMEGLAALGNQLVQLSWRAGKGFIYDRKSFTLLDTFEYPGQGWGLTLHGQQLIMSDGSSFLRFLDSASMRESGRVQVKKRGQPVKNLNELEMVRGSLYANVWHSDLILIISPYTGVVTGQVNLQGLLQRYAPHARANVLNGIAYDDKNDRLFVTGKRWPLLFEIRLKEKG